MKIGKLLIAMGLTIVFGHKEVFGQTPNLLKNGSFETVTECPSVNGPTFPASYWRSFKNSADIWVHEDARINGKKCGMSQAVKTGIASKPRSGVAHAGIAFNEYISTSTGVKLEKGKVYDVVYYTRNGFGGVPTDIKGVITDFLPYSGHVGSMSPNFAVTSSSASNGYIKFTGTYEPEKTGNYYISFGHFGNSSGGYVVLDDVSIRGRKCAKEKFIQNRGFSNETELFKATEAIHIGTNVDNSSATGDVVLGNNSHIVVKAPVINVKPSVHFERGGFYHLIPVSDCDEGDCPKNPISSDEIHSCLQQGDIYEKSIGTSLNDDYIFKWSPTTFLDDPYSSNPVLKSQLPDGDRTYSVNITSECGDAWQVTRRRVWNTNTGSAPIYIISADENQSGNQATINFHVGNNIEEFKILIPAEGKILTFDQSDVSNGVFEYKFKPTSICGSTELIIAGKNHCDDKWVEENYVFDSGCECLDFDKNDKFELIFINGSAVNRHFSILAEGVKYVDFNFWDRNREAEVSNVSEVPNFFQYNGKEYINIFTPPSSWVGRRISYAGTLYGCNGQIVDNIRGELYIYTGRSMEVNEGPLSADDEIEKTEIISSKQIDSEVIVEIERGLNPGTLTVFDALGKQVFNSEGVNFRISELNPGMYILKFSNSDFSSTKKIVVK